MRPRRRSFYTSVFGWKINDMPIPDGSVYTMLQVDGHDLGALYENKEHPPDWNSYVNVASVDESAQRAQENGATVIAPPFDVMDVGRMAVIADPAGASLCLWQAEKTHRRHDPRRLQHALLERADDARHRRRARVLQEPLRLEPEGQPRIHRDRPRIDRHRRHDADHARDAGDADRLDAVLLRPRCDAYGREDRSRSAARSTWRRTDIPNVGRFAVCADPQGAMFNIIKPKRDRRHVGSTCRAASGCWRPCMESSTSSACRRSPSS